MEIGYGLAAPSRGQGYGSEAVAAVTEWLLSQPGVRQVRAHTLTSNAPSRRVLEKAGFTYVGLDEGEALYQRRSLAADGGSFEPVVGQGGGEHPEHPGPAWPRRHHERVLHVGGERERVALLQHDAAPRPR